MDVANPAMEVDEGRDAATAQTVATDKVMQVQNLQSEQQVACSAPADCDVQLHAFSKLNEVLASSRAGTGSTSTATDQGAGVSTGAATATAAAAAAGAADVGGAVAAAPPIEAAAAQAAADNGTSHVAHQAAERSTTESAPTAADKPNGSDIAAAAAADKPDGSGTGAAAATEQQTASTLAASGSGQAAAAVTGDGCDKAPGAATGANTTCTRIVQLTEGVQVTSTTGNTDLPPQNTGLPPQNRDSSRKAAGSKKAPAKRSLSVAAAAGRGPKTSTQSQGQAQGSGNTGEPGDAAAGQQGAISEDTTHTDDALHVAAGQQGAISVVSKHTEDAVDVAAAQQDTISVQPEHVLIGAKHNSTDAVTYAIWHNAAECLKQKVQHKPVQVILEQCDELGLGLPTGKMYASVAQFFNAAGSVSNELALATVYEETVTVCEHTITKGAAVQEMFDAACKRPVTSKISQPASSVHNATDGNPHSAGDSMGKVSAQSSMPQSGADGAMAAEVKATGSMVKVEPREPRSKRLSRRTTHGCAACYWCHLGCEKCRPELEAYGTRTPVKHSTSTQHVVLEDEDQEAGEGEGEGEGVEEEQGQGLPHTKHKRQHKVQYERDEEQPSRKRACVLPARTVHYQKEKVVEAGQLGVAEGGRQKQQKQKGRKQVHSVENEDEEMQEQRVVSEGVPQRHQEHKQVHSTEEADEEKEQGGRKRAKLDKAAEVQAAAATVPGAHAKASTGTNARSRVLLPTTVKASPKAAARQSGKVKAASAGPKSGGVTGEPETPVLKPTASAAPPTTKAYTALDSVPEEQRLSAEESAGVCEKLLALLPTLPAEQIDCSMALPGHFVLKVTTGFSSLLSQLNRRDLTHATASKFLAGLRSQEGRVGFCQVFYPMLLGMLQANDTVGAMEVYEAWLAS